MPLTKPNSHKPSHGGLGYFYSTCYLYQNKVFGCLLAGAKAIAPAGKLAGNVMRHEQIIRSEIESLNEGGKKYYT